MKIEVDHLEGEDVIKLLEEHLADMHATSPPESIHALDVDSLKSPDITFWCARENGQALGCIALKQLTASQAEIKSMRTTENSRGRGVGSANRFSRPFPTRCTYCLSPAQPKSQHDQATISCSVTGNIVAI